MAEKKQKTPIELMADLLAEMTARAIEAERQRDEALKSSDDWYKNWQRQSAKLKETEALLEKTETSLNEERDERHYCEVRIEKLIEKYEAPTKAEEEKEGAADNE